MLTQDDSAPLLVSSLASFGLRLQIEKRLLLILCDDCHFSKHVPVMIFETATHFIQLAVKQLAELLLESDKPPLAIQGVMARRSASTRRSGRL